MPPSNLIPSPLAEAQSTNNIPTQILNTKFGKPEDIIEAHVYNRNNELLQSYPNIKNSRGVTLDYSQADITNNTSNPPGDDLNPSNTNPQSSPPQTFLFDTVEVNSDAFLSENAEFDGLSFGEYTIHYHFLRPKLVLRADLTPQDFLLKTISPSRTEIEVQNPGINNNVIQSTTSNFISDLNSYSFFRDFIVNFHNDKISTGLNVALNKADPNNYTLYIKLYEPLPDDVSVGDNLFIAEKLTDSVSVDVSFLPPTFRGNYDSSTPIAPPNFTIDITKNLSVPTDYKTYNDLLLSEDSSSYRRLLNKMGQVKPAIDYREFENFVHFGSATERLKNFQYKIELYELYNSQLNDLSSSLSSNSFISANEEIVEKKIDNLIENLDGFESYMFFESTSFAWPKTTATIPYQLASTTSTEALTWIGSEIEGTYYYGGRLESSSLYDKLNQYNLLNTVPLHIRDNSENQQYEIFVQMIGQHFDQIWTYIDDIGEIKDADNSPDRGISRDLVYYALKSIGLDGFKANFDSNFVTDLLETSVSASTICDFVEDQDISDIRNINSVTGIKTSMNDYNKELWKRIYHNAPYLLKTRGTERGLRALINCYGIPDTILQIKEFGGPQKTASSPNYYIHNKYSYGFSINKGIDTYSTITSSYGGLVAHNEYIEDLGGRTVEFRFKTPYKEDQIIWEKGLLPEVSDYYVDGYADPFYVDELTDNDFNFVMSLEHSSSAAAGTYNGGLSQYYDYGRVVFTATGGPSGTEVISGSLTPYAPIFDGDWWNLSFRIPASGSLIMETDLQKAPDGLEKQYTNIIKYTASGDFDFSTVTSGSAIIDDFYYNSLITIGRGFSGSLQEYREYSEYLDDDVLKGHAESPEMFDGNTYSSSFDSLYFRLSLGFDLETTLISSSGELVNMCNVGSGSSDLRGSLNSIHPDQSTKRSAQISGSFLYTGNEENLYTRYPNGSSANLSSNKVRIENGIFDSPPILSFNVRGEAPAYDTTPIDSSKLGVYFSPTYEMDRDITGELGLYDMDQYIGDPSDIDKSNYTDIELLEDHYKKKKPTNLNRYKFEDYIRLIQFFDTSLFEAIEQFVPARVTLMKGLVIEPTLFDRSKIPTYYPTWEDLTYSASIASSSMLPGINSEYLLTDVEYDIFSYYEQFEEINPLYGNFTEKKFSNYYATVVGNSEIVTTIPPAGGIGPTLPPNIER
jgi:hypothetical protein